MLTFNVSRAPSSNESTRTGNRRRRRCVEPHVPDRVRSGACRYPPGSRRRSTVEGRAAEGGERAVRAHRRLAARHDAPDPRRAPAQGGRRAHGRGAGPLRRGPARRGARARAASPTRRTPRSCWCAATSSSPTSSARTSSPAPARRSGPSARRCCSCPATTTPPTPPACSAGRTSCGGAPPTSRCSTPRGCTRSRPASRSSPRPWRSKHPLTDLVGEQLAALEPAPAGTLRVLAGHGELDVLDPDDDEPARIRRDGVLAALADGRVHYAALGDRHSAWTDAVDDRIRHAGTPEVTDFDEVDPGHVLVVDLDDRAARVTHRDRGRWRFVRHDAALDTDADLDALDARLAALPDKERTAVRLALVGTLSLRQRSRLDDLLAGHGLAFAAVEVVEQHSDLATVPDDADLARARPARVRRRRRRGALRRGRARRGHGRRRGPRRAAACCTGWSGAADEAAPHPAARLPRRARPRGRRSPSTGSPCCRATTRSARPPRSWRSTCSSTRPTRRAARRSAPPSRPGSTPGPRSRRRSPPARTASSTASAGCADRAPSCTSRRRPPSSSPAPTPTPA